MGYATRHPDKVKRLIILNTGGFRLPKECPFPWPIWLFRHTDLIASLNMNFNAFSFIASHTCSIKGMSRKVRYGFRAPYDCPANRVATTRFVQDIPLSESDPSYNELVKIGISCGNSGQQAPAIICFGRKDFVSTVISSTSGKNGFHRLKSTVFTQDITCWKMPGIRYSDWFASFLPKTPDTGADSCPRIISMG